MPDAVHPYFTSGLRWHARLADALAEAKQRNLKVFVQHGQRLCTGTRALVERTLAKEEVAEVMTQHFVALVSDADHTEPEIAALLEHVQRREPTPVCLYLDATGKLLASTAGGRPPAVLLNDMLTAMSKR